MTSLLLALLLAPGCGNDCDDPCARKEAGATDSRIADSLSPDAKAPEPYAFSGLEPFDPVKGTVTVKASGTAPISKLELLVNSGVLTTLTKAPWEFSWDTTGWPDGPVRLALRATTQGGATVTSKIMTVMVLNYGEEVTLLDAATAKPGNGSTVDVGPNGYDDQHLRYWWQVKKDIKHVAVVLFWDDPAFHLELQVGPGQCPEHGPGSIAGTSSTVSPIYLIAGDGDGMLVPTLAAGMDEYQYFAHVQLMNVHEVLGKKCPFRLRAYTIKAAPTTP